MSMEGAFSRRVVSRPMSQPLQNHDYNFQPFLSIFPLSTLNKPI
jgi:hypothetical protein